jgi:hypothetical protein
MDEGVVRTIDTGTLEAEVGQRKGLGQVGQRLAAAADGAQR